MIAYRNHCDTHLEAALINTLIYPSNHPIRSKHYK